jgi:hypothetical protein
MVFPVEDKLVALDFIRQFVAVIRSGREMARQSFGRHGNARHDGFCESAGAQFLANRGSNFAPEDLAAFFVDSPIAHDRELLGTGRKVEQNGIALASGSHAELFKPGRGALNNIIGAERPVRDKDPDFARSLELGVPNGRGDFCVVQLPEKVLGLHLCYQLPLAPPPPKLPPPPRKLPPPRELRPPPLQPPPIGGVHTVRRPDGP